MIRALIFDWGDTIMRDFPMKKSPMYQWKQVEWVPGAKEALEVLHNKFIMVIATNAMQSSTLDMMKALKRIGADKYFRHFFSSKELGFNKPDKRFFLSIANRIHATPDECAMIGNSYEKDIEGAKRSGMFTVYFNEDSFAGEFPMADRTIKSLSELRNIFVWDIIM